MFLPPSSISMPLVTLLSTLPHTLHYATIRGPILKTSNVRPWIQIPCPMALALHGSVPAPTAKTVQTKPMIRQNAEFLKPSFLPKSMRWSSMKMMTACPRKKMKAASSSRDPCTNIALHPWTIAEIPKPTNNWRYFDANEPLSRCKTSRAMKMPGAEQMRLQF
jgi:hypothetical protein